MKFLVDANLPFRLSKHLKTKGIDVIHTDDLINKERTTDQEIRRISSIQNRIIITKDADFLDSHIVQGVPSKLLYIATGNITNAELLNLFGKHFDQIMILFEKYKLIEMNNEYISVHEK